MDIKIREQRRVMIRKIFIILFILCLASTVYSKTGISIIPIRAENEDAITSGVTTTAKRIIESVFSKEPIKYNLRLDAEESLRQLQMQMEGLVKEGKFKYLEAVDYFIIGSVWQDDNTDTIIFTLRAMDSQTCKIEFAKTVTVQKKQFESRLKNLANQLKSTIDQINDIEKLQKDTITVFKIEEDGDKFLDGAVASMFLTGLYNTGEFYVIEREQASWAIQEKEIEVSGIVNRDSLRKVKDIYNLKLSIEGYVVTKNPGIISFDIKVVDLERGVLLFRRYGECYSYKEMQETINRIAKDIADKYYRRTGKLKIASIPTESAIYIDGKYWAKTPAIITELDKGLYELRLKKAGYDIYEKSVTILARKQITINAKLKKQNRKYFKSGLIAEKRKEWKQAIEYFDKFANAYPNTKEAIDAKFRIAHICQYNLKKYNIAIETYDKLIKSYSGLWILSESMYGLGSCLIEIGKTEEGRGVLQKLISEYSETSAADYAREKLVE